MVNSGAMYRAITWRVLHESVNPGDHAAVIGLLNRLTIECGDDGLCSTITIDGCDPGEALRGETVNANVSTIAAIPEVRARLVALQRDYLTRTNIVMEGRDIGSVVFPDTPYKIYVHADEHVRAARRRNMGEIDSVARRDAADTNRTTAPLMIAPGAAVLDNSNHSVESSVLAALAILKHQGLAV